MAEILTIAFVGASMTVGSLVLILPTVPAFRRFCGEI